MKSYVYLYINLFFHCHHLFQSRAAVSLLGYCYYQLQDFVNAADSYEQLSMLHPEVEEYKLYYCQSLFKACLYEEAMKVSHQIDNPKFQSQVCIQNLFEFLNL